jgi:hypothetical protein
MQGKFVLSINIQQLCVLKEHLKIGNIYGKDSCFVASPVVLVSKIACVEQYLFPLEFIDISASYSLKTDMFIVKTVENQFT